MWEETLLAACLSCLVSGEEERFESYINNVPDNYLVKVY